MSPSTPEDPVALEVRAVPQTSDAGPLPWDFYNVYPNFYRMHLVGFSFFGEIGSYEPDGTSDNYIQVEQSTASDAGNCVYDVVETDQVPLEFSNQRWMKMLSCRRINFSRVFIFPTYKEVRYFPFQQNGRYVLRAVSNDYKARLNDYILKAKERGVVVCLSLFSDQMLRINKPGADAFLYNPFRNTLNTRDTKFIDVLESDTDNTIRTKFYTISEPKITDKAPEGWKSLQSQVAWESWSDEEKLYAVQRNLVTEIVNATRSHWNVLYEVSNEPRKTIDSTLEALTLEWIKKVAGWLDELLWDPTNHKHKRLIMVNLEKPSTPGSFRAKVLSALRKDDFHLKVDVFSFHGAEWSDTSLAGNITDLGNINIAAQPGWPDRKLKEFPLAIVFDTDAHDAAQAQPDAYLKAVRAAKGNFNCRWAEVSRLTHRLEQINRANPPTGFAMSTANNVVTYRWNPVPHASEYVISL